jgi:hypothetical protein
MRMLVALLLTVTLLAVPAPVHAQACAPDAFPQHDMAGVYVSPEHRMRVEIFPCGGAYVRWTNAYGTHSMAYGSYEHLRGGGVLAERLPDMPGVSLDDSRRIAFKPAEPGYIQAITFGVYSDTIRVYHLRKSNQP